MPIFSSTGGTMPSRSSTRAASRCTGASSGLPCSEASSFARWTASCALTVNLSQRMAMTLLTPDLRNLDLQIANYKKRGRRRCSRLPLSLRFVWGRATRPSNQAKPGQLSLRGFGHALRLFAFEHLLAADIYLDLLRLGFGFLRQLDLQHALVIVGVNVFMADRLGEGEGAGEAAILTLHATIVLFFLFLLELALAVHRQSVVLDADIDVLLVDSRHFDFQGDVVLVLVDVHGRGKCGCG